MKTIQELKSRKKRSFSEVSHKLLYIYTCIFSDSLNLLFRYAISSFIRCFLKFQNFATDGNCPSIKSIQKCYCCNCNRNWASHETRKTFRKRIILNVSRKGIKWHGFTFFFFFFLAKYVGKVKPCILMHLKEQIKFYRMGISSLPTAAFGQFWFWQ